MAKSKATHPEGGVEKFLVLPIIVLILAQMGTSGDNGALGLANQQLVDVLGATTPDIQLANMVYSLMAGAFMAAGGLVGTIIGWRTNFRLGAALCAAGELVMALSPNMTIFIWGGRILVGFGASFMIPSVLGLIPFIYHGKNRVLAFGCIGAASGLSAFLPLFLGIVMQFGGFRVTFGALAVYFALVLLLSFKLPAIEKPAEKLKFDGLGTGIAATGLFLFLGRPLPHLRLGPHRALRRVPLHHLRHLPGPAHGHSRPDPARDPGAHGEARRAEERHRPSAPVLLEDPAGARRPRGKRHHLLLHGRSGYPPVPLPAARCRLVPGAHGRHGAGRRHPHLHLLAGHSEVYAQRQPAPRHPGRQHRDGLRLHPHGLLAARL